MDRKKARHMMLTEMMKHKLSHWKFKYIKAKRTRGQCDYWGSTLSLSSSFVDHNEEPAVLDTILHEIAHALVGSGHGHDAVWKAKCKELGCYPGCVSDQSFKVSAPGKWTWTCTTPECGRSFQIYRKRKWPVSEYRCKCGGRLTEKAN